MNKRKKTQKVVSKELKKAFDINLLTQDEESIFSDPKDDTNSNMLTLDNDLLNYNNENITNKRIIGKKKRRCLFLLPGKISLLAQDNIQEIGRLKNMETSTPELIFNFKDSGTLHLYGSIEEPQNHFFGLEYTASSKSRKKKENDIIIKNGAFDELIVFYEYKFKDENGKIIDIPTNIFENGTNIVSSN